MYGHHIALLPCGHGFAFSLFTWQGGFYACRARVCVHWLGFCLYAIGYMLFVPVCFLHMPDFPFSLGLWHTMGPTPCSRVFFFSISPHAIGGATGFDVVTQKVRRVSCF